MSAATGCQFSSGADAPSSPRDGELGVERSDQLPSGLVFSDAFRALYGQFFAQVWRGLLRLGVQRPVLEDAVQDVFLVIHRKDGEFAGKSSLKTWIYGIVLRVAKDYRRSEARHRRRVQSLREVLISTPPPSAVEEMEQREAAQLVYRALDRLDDERREVLVLVELEELPVREVATLLNLQLRTCQRRVKEARELFEGELNALLEPAASAGSSGRRGFTKGAKP